MSVAATGPADPHEVLDSSHAGRLALQGSALRTGAYVAGLLLSLVSAPLLTRHLGVVEFGRYVTVTALIAIVAGFTASGLNVVVTRGFSTLAEPERHGMMRAAIGIRLLLTFAGVALATVFALGAGYTTAMVLGTVLAGAGLVLQLLQSLLSTTLSSRLRFGWASAIELLRQVVNVTLIVTLVLVGAGLLPLLAVALPASAVSLAATIPLILGYTPLRPSFHFARWWRVLRESIPWAVVAAVNVVYLRIAIVVMSLVAAAVQTGYFAISFRIMEVLVGIPVILLAPAFPILARSERGDSARFARASERMFELSLLAAVWLVVCVEVSAPFAIHVLAGSKADPAIAVLRIQGLSLIGNFVAMACGLSLLTAGRHRPVLAANLMALATSATITAALSPSLGARGGAVAALAGESGLALVSALLLARSLPSARLPLGTIAVAALAGGAAVAAGVLLPIHPVAGVVVASCVFLLVLAVCQRLPPELGELLGDVTGKLSRAR
jgi:O-antigen/teichoic acid export membrane protein